MCAYRVISTGVSVGTGTSKVVLEFLLFLEKRKLLPAISYIYFCYKWYLAFHSRNICGGSVFVDLMFHGSDG